MINNQARGINHYQSLLKHYSSDFNLVINLGDLYRLNGDLVQAAEHYRKGLELHDKSARIRLVCTYLEQNNYELAAKFAKTETIAEDPQLAYHLGIAHINMDQWEEALDAFQIVKKSGEFPQVAKALTYTHYALGNLKDASKAASDWRSEELDYESFWVSSLIEGRLGNYNESLSLAHRARNYSLNRCEAIYAELMLLFLSGQRQRALEILEISLANEELDNTLLLIAKGVFSIHLGHNVMALKIFNSLQELRLSGERQNVIAWIHLLNQAFQTAISCFEEAIEQHFRTESSYGGLALAQAFAGQRVNAETALEEANKINPHGYSVRAARNILNLIYAAPAEKSNIASKRITDALLKNPLANDRSTQDYLVFLVTSYGFKLDKPALPIEFPNW